MFVDEASRWNRTHGAAANGSLDVCPNLLQSKAVCGLERHASSLAVSLAVINKFFEGHALSIRDWVRLKVEWSSSRGTIATKMLAGGSQCGAEGKKRVGWGLAGLVSRA